MFCNRMEVFSSIEDLGRSTDEPVFLALGMFDGVHRGHLSVLELAKKMAAGKGRAVAFTFPEHPSSYLRPEQSPGLLMNKDQKVEHLLKAGMDGVVLRTFDREFAGVEAAHFPAFLIARIPSLSGLCVGENFRFGKGRNGDQLFLQEIGKEVGLSVGVAKSEMLDNLPISSSRIRNALAEGDVTLVNKMLGWKYTISGNVVKGKGLGREIGSPTINLRWNRSAYPAYGVYTGWVRANNLEGKKYAIANYGLRPTVESDAKNPLLEIHILDAVEKEFGLEGEQMSMTLETFLRLEQKFDSVDELREQIKIDLQLAESHRT